MEDVVKESITYWRYWKVNKENMIGQVEKIIKKQLLSNLMSCSSRFLTVKKIKDRYSIIFGKKIKGHSTYSIIPGSDKLLTL